MVLRDVAAPCGAGSSNQPEKRILSALALAKKQLDGFADELRSITASNATKRSQLAILVLSEVELDTYHTICMIHLLPDVNAPQRTRRHGAQAWRRAG